MIHLLSSIVVALAAVGLELPDDVMKFLKRYAEAKKQSVDEILKGMVLSEVRARIETLSEEEKLRLLDLDSLL